METFERNPWRLVWQGLPVFHCEVLLLGPCKVTLITCWMSKVSHFTWPTSWISTWRIIYSSVAEGPVTKDLIGVDMGWLVSSSYLKGMARTQSYTHIHVCIVCIYNIQKDYIYIYTLHETHTYLQAGPIFYGQRSRCWSSRFGSLATIFLVS